MFGKLKNSRIELSDSSTLRKQWEVRTPKLWIQLWDFSSLRFCQRQNVCFLVPTSLHHLSYQLSFYFFLFHSGNQLYELKTHWMGCCWWGRKNIGIFTYKQWLLSIDMKTKVVQYVERESEWESVPGFQVLSDVQTYFHSILFLPF